MTVIEINNCAGGGLGSMRQDDDTCDLFLLIVQHNCSVTLPILRVINSDS